MPRTPFDMDPDSPGSRFTLRPAIAVPGGDGTDEIIRAALTESLDAEILERDPALGEPDVARGGIGRGAEGFAGVIEWIGAAVAAGLIGGAAWDGAKAAGKRLAALAKRAFERRPDYIIMSRGAAALIAIDHLAGLDPAIDGLVLEAVEEPSSIAGRDSPELNYVGIEPWLVFLVDPRTQTRYVVAVSSDGQILGDMKFPFQKLEEYYFPVQLPDDVEG
jgi:hypothetical protein